MAFDPRSPTPPLSPRLFVRWLWRLIRDVVEEYGEDGVADLAASITFWTILSVPAAVLALVSALSSLDAVVGTSAAQTAQDEVQQFISDTLVDSAALSQTVDELFTTSSTGVATVAILIALFTLSRAFAGLIRALDIAYEVEESRPWWYLRFVAIGLGIATIVVVAAAATALAILPSLPLSSALRLLTAPAVFVGLVLWAAALFHFAPNHRTPWRYELPGAVVTALGWVLASQGFATYVRVSGGTNQVQSSVAAVLFALTLMYLLSLVLLVGAEINDVLARRSGVVQQLPSVQERARSFGRDLSRRRPGSTRQTTDAGADADDDD